MVIIGGTGVCKIDSVNLFISLESTFIWNGVNDIDIKQMVLDDQTDGFRLFKHTLLNNI